MVQLRRQHQTFVRESLDAHRRFAFKQNQRLPALSEITRSASSRLDCQPSAKTDSQLHQVRIVSSAA